LTEAVRIVARVAREMQVSADGAYGRGYHVVWCPKYRRRFLAFSVAARCKGLNHARASDHGSRMVAMAAEPHPVRLFVKAHRSDSSSQIVGPFKASPRDGCRPRSRNYGARNIATRAGLGSGQAPAA
jgi:REP element-mobilizing transposase RayT